MNPVIVGNHTACSFCDGTDLVNDGQVWICLECKQMWRPALTRILPDGKRQIGYIGSPSFSSWEGHQ